MFVSATGAGNRNTEEMDRFPGGRTALALQIIKQSKRRNGNTKGLPFLPIYNVYPNNYFLELLVPLSLGMMYVSIHNR
jgi:hypothetical protein